MPILRQVRSIKYDFSIKTSLHPGLGCAPRGVPVSGEVLSIPGDVSSKLFIPLPFKDQHCEKLQLLTPVPPTSSL